MNFAGPNVNFPSYPNLWAPNNFTMEDIREISDLAREHFMEPAPALSWGSHCAMAACFPDLVAPNPKFFHCRRLAFDFIRLYPDAEFDKWPAFDAFAPVQNELFLLLLCLAAIPQIRRPRAAIGVPEDITRDTRGDIVARVLTAMEFKNGELGVAKTSVRRLRKHVRGDLFQIGRFHVSPDYTG